MDCTCLAIGDGNNDAPMIKLASIGVAIRGATCFLLKDLIFFFLEGVEGTAAVAASDYVISQVPNVSFNSLMQPLCVYASVSVPSASAFSAWSPQLPKDRLACDVYFLQGIFLPQSMTLINFVIFKTGMVCWALFFNGMYSAFSGEFFILDWVGGVIWVSGTFK
jgi:hypothetical protein